MSLSGFLSSAAQRIRSRVSDQHGIALLMVLVVITLLATLVVSFTDTTQKHLQVTQYYKNRVQAYWAAQSGLQAAAGLLKNDPEITKDYNGPGSLWNCESASYQEFVIPILANVFCESSMIEPALLLSQASAAETETTLSRCPAAAPILDENRKLSIAGLVKNPGTINETTDDTSYERLVLLLQYLLREDDLAPAQEQESLSATTPPLETPITIGKARELAGYLVDWMDTPNNKNAELNPDMAEESCPVDELPYEAKQGMLDSVDEIGLVCGFRQMSRPTIEKLTQHLTNYELKTNINTATVPVLYAFTQEEEKADKIYRDLHPTGEQEIVTAVQSDATCREFLANEGAEGSLCGSGTTTTAGFSYKSDYFRIGIYGLVFDKETGTVSVRARLQMDLYRQQGGQLALLYYRED